MCDQFTPNPEFRIDTRRTKYEQKTDGILHVCGSSEQGTKNPDAINLDAPGLAWYKQKSMEETSKHCVLGRRHASSLLYPEGCHDEIWSRHIRESICVTSSSKDFHQGQLDERIGFRSCWRWERLPTTPTQDQKSNC